MMLGCWFIVTYYSNQCVTIHETSIFMIIGGWLADVAFRLTTTLRMKVHWSCASELASGCRRDFASDDVVVSQCVHTPLEHRLPLASRARTGISFLGQLKSVNVTRRDRRLLSNAEHWSILISGNKYNTKLQSMKFFASAICQRTAIRLFAHANWNWLPTGLTLLSAGLFVCRLHWWYCVCGGCGWDDCIWLYGWNVVYAASYTWTLCAWV